MLSDLLEQIQYVQTQPSGAPIQLGFPTYQVKTTFLLTWEDIKPGWSYHPGGLGSHTLTLTFSSCIPGKAGSTGGIA